MKNKRKSWDEYFLGLLDSVAERATCDRGRNVAIITVDNEIVTTGFMLNRMLFCGQLRMEKLSKAEPCIVK